MYVSILKYLQMLLLREVFARVNDKLSGLTYGSEEYNASLAELKVVALPSHYAKNRHHPEHFTKGINDMNLIDIMEMFADWKASSERQNNGNLLTSITKNAERYQIDDQLKQILINTAKFLDEHNSH